MLKAIILGLVMIAILAVLYIVIKPIAYCLLAGILIGGIIWTAKRLFDDD